MQMTTETRQNAKELPSGPDAVSSGLWGRMASLLTTDPQPASRRDNREVFKWVDRALRDASTDRRLPRDLRVQAIDALRTIKEGELNGDKLPGDAQSLAKVRSVVEALYDLGVHHARQRDTMSVKYVGNVRRELAAHAGVKATRPTFDRVYDRYPEWRP